MNPPNKQWIILGIFLIAGVLFTFWDYYQYRKLETQNYGHGPGQVAATWDLSENYQDEIKRFRLKYPQELVLNADNSSFTGSEVTISLKIKTVTGTLKDLEDQEIASLSPNEQMFGERSYENTERVNMTVINFQRFVGNNTYMVSRYLAKKDDRLYILEFTSDLASWQQNEPNFKSMARTLVLL